MVDRFDDWFLRNTAWIVLGTFLLFFGLQLYGTDLEIFDLEGVSLFWSTLSVGRAIIISANASLMVTLLAWFFLRCLQGFRRESAMRSLVQSFAIVAAISIIVSVTALNNVTVMVLSLVIAVVATAGYKLLSIFVQ